MDSLRDNGSIEPGDAGIFVTCVRGKEGKATEELKDMFEEVFSPSFPENSNLPENSVLSAFTALPPGQNRPMTFLPLMISKPRSKRRSN